MCGGMLDDGYVCILCSDSFCKDCEKRKKFNHVCKEEDVESIKVVNEFVRFPKCKVPVQKIDGCSEVTCAMCNNHFHHNTGIAGGYGNHGKNGEYNVKEIKLTTGIDLIKNVDKRAEIYDLLVKVEKCRPGVPSEDLLYDLVVNILKKGKYNENLYDKFIQEYDRFYIQLEKYKKYVRDTEEIENRIKTGKISKWRIQHLIDEYTD
jgi:hypothetical protein